MYLLTIYLLDVPLVGLICHYRVEIEFDNSSSIHSFDNEENSFNFGKFCYYLWHALFYYFIIVNNSTFSNPTARNEKDSTNQISNTDWFIT